MRARRRFIPNSGGQPEPSNVPSTNLREWGWSDSARKSAAAARAAIKTGNPKPKVIGKQQSPSSAYPGSVLGSGPAVVARMGKTNLQLNAATGQLHISAAKAPGKNGAYYIGAIQKRSAPDAGLSRRLFNMSPGKAEGILKNIRRAHTKVSTR